MPSQRPYQRAFLVIRPFNLPKELRDRYQYDFCVSRHRGIGQQAQKSHSSKVKPVEVEPRLAQKNLGSMPLHLGCSPPLGGPLPTSALPGPCSSLHPHSTLTPSGLPKAHHQPEIFSKPSHHHLGVFSFLSILPGRHRHQAFCHGSLVFL